MFSKYLWHYFLIFATKVGITIDTTKCFAIYFYKNEKNGAEVRKNLDAASYTKRTSSDRPSMILPLIISTPFNLL